MAKAIHLNYFCKGINKNKTISLLKHTIMFGFNILLCILKGYFKTISLLFVSKHVSFVYSTETFGAASLNSQNNWGNVHPGETGVNV